MRKANLITSLVLGLMIFNAFVIPTLVTSAKPQAVEITIGYSEYQAGSSYRVKITGLTVSTAYVVYFTAGCHDNYTFTTGALETSLAPRFVIEAPTSGIECLIGLTTSVANTVIVAQERMYLANATDIINQDGLTDLIMIMVVIMAVLSLFLGMFAYRRTKS